ncbi:hypothetical protein DFS34DRAFT_28099 [Phlyctochytrium arcticum]|nr:hypothetical protein DFS34DRAFT_28099 [Phlyctochytrium arcticum]
MKTNEQAKQEGKAPTLSSKKRKRMAVEVAQDLSLITNRSAKNRKGWQNSRFNRGVVIFRYRDRLTGKIVTVDPLRYKDNLRRPESYDCPTSVTKLSWPSDEYTPPPNATKPSQIVEVEQAERLKSVRLPIVQEEQDVLPSGFGLFDPSDDEEHSENDTDEDILDSGILMDLDVQAASEPLPEEEFSDFEVVPATDNPQLPAGLFDDSDSDDDFQVAKHAPIISNTGPKEALNGTRAAAGTDSEADFEVVPATDGRQSPAGLFDESDSDDDFQVAKPAPVISNMGPKETLNGTGDAAGIVSEADDDISEANDDDIDADDGTDEAGGDGGERDVKGSGADIVGGEVNGDGSETNTIGSEANRDGSETDTGGNDANGNGSEGSSKSSEADDSEQEEHSSEDEALNDSESHEVALPTASTPSNSKPKAKIDHDIEPAQDEAIQDASRHFQVNTNLRALVFGKDDSDTDQKVDNAEVSGGLFGFAVEPEYTFHEEPSASAPLFSFGNDGMDEDVDMKVADDAEVTKSLGTSSMFFYHLEDSSLHHRSKYAPTYAFMRTQTVEEIYAQWEAQREELTHDYKGKNKLALRKKEKMKRSKGSTRR